MKIAIPKERRDGEARVAASPDAVKRLLNLPLDNVSVAVETGAGEASAYPDQTFKDAGATICRDYRETVKGADVVLKVRRPITKDEKGDLDELAPLEKGCKLIGLLDPWQAGTAVRAFAAAGIDAFAMEFMPRITRAQAMDALSSQANLAGYRAVIEAAHQFKRAFPMMMTAAGTVPPARTLIMGAGVAGLQAVATARRLGASVSATDVRPAAKQEVESLGAKFVAVEDEEFKEAEAAGGYAKEMSDAYKKKQAELIADTIRKMDIVITTALIPGRPAPKLVTADMVRSMKPGSVIVDLAVAQGGNVELSEVDKVVECDGVAIVGYANWPSRIAVSASSLYARNVSSFLELMVDKEKKTLAINTEDEIIKGTCLTLDGKVVHPNLQDLAGGEGAGAGTAGAAASSSTAKSASTKSSSTKSRSTKSSATKSGTRKTGQTKKADTSKAGEGEGEGDSTSQGGDAAARGGTDEPKGSTTDGSNKES